MFGGVRKAWGGLEADKGIRAIGILGGMLLLTALAVCSYYIVIAGPRRATSGQDMMIGDASSSGSWGVI
jgi:hypothetical protein